MKPIEVMETYLALKLMFKGKYDASKYNYRIPVTEETFYKRRDRHLFERLAADHKTKDSLIEYLVAHLRKDIDWIGDMGDKDNILEYTKCRLTMSYSFKKDMKTIVEDSTSFEDGFMTGEQYPSAFRLLLENEVNLESLAILHALTKFGDQEFDQLIWPYWKHRITAMSKILEISDEDLTKYRKILCEALADGYK